MQEIAIVLTGIAGAITAGAIKKFPRNKSELVTLGSSPQIKSQINSLAMEKDILTKTISRLYQSNVGLTKIQRDKLLIRYQHQLGIVLTKLEKLQAASKHPDMGPLGDGLVTLMDQKLSQLDQSLYELSSKITVANAQVEKQETVKEQKPEPKKVIPQIELPTHTPHRSIELTTLTQVSPKPAQFPTFENKPKVVQKEPTVDPISEENIAPKISQEPLPEPVKLDASESIEKFVEEDDSDDLDKIKGDILKTLSKLEQAEVE